MIKINVQKSFIIVTAYMMIIIGAHNILVVFVIK